TALGSGRVTKAITATRSRRPASEAAMQEANYDSIHKHGFIRTAAATPLVATADPARNAAATLELIRAADREGVDLVVFPELGLSSYAIDDLVLQDALLEPV